MSSQAAKDEKDQVRAELEEVLAYHDGNALAAVQTLLADCKHLRGQLAITECAMSRGLTRGWRPKYDRQG
jgi:hypothetical protein